MIAKSKFSGIMKMSTLELWNKPEIVYFSNICRSIFFVHKLRSGGPNLASDPVVEGFSRIG